MALRLLPLAAALGLVFHCLPLSAQPVRPSTVSLKAEQSLNSLVSQGKLHLSQRADDVRRVEMLGELLAKVARRPIPWHFYVITDKKPNAFTPGEGVVIVSEGLLDLNLDQDELAGVLAHEIAHGTGQHGQLDASRKSKLERDTQALNSDYAELRAQYAANKIDKDIYQSRLHFLERRAEDLKKDMNYLEGQQKYRKEFNHEKEIEADVVGLRYAVAAGYKPDGLQRALIKLLNKGVEQFGRGYTGEGYTHPSTAKRLEVLQRVQAQMRN